MDSSQDEAVEINDGDREKNAVMAEVGALVQTLHGYFDAMLNEAVDSKSNEHPSIFAGISGFFLAYNLLRTHWCQKNVSRFGKP